MDSFNLFLERGGGTIWWERSYKRIEREYVLQLLTDLNNNIIVLTPAQIDQYIHKMSAYNKSSYITLFAQEVLLPLVKHHMLTEKQVTTILKKCTKLETTPAVTWIGELIKKGYKMTAKQATLFAELGYHSFADKLSTFPENSSKKDILACLASRLTPDDVDKILDKYKIVPDIDYYKVIINNSTMTTGDTVKILFKHEFKPNSDAITFIIDNLLEHCATSVGQPEIVGNLFRDLIDNGAKVLDTHYDKLVDFYFEHNSVKHKTNHNMSQCTTAWLLPIIYIMSVSLKPKPDMLTRLFTVECAGGRDPEIKLINLFVKDFGFKIDGNFCNLVCMRGGEATFKYLIENNMFIMDSKALYYACKHGSEVMINALINMKAVPTIDSIRDIAYTINHDLVGLLFTAGLPATYEVVDMLISRRVYLQNLESYDLNDYDRLFFIWHKYYDFKNTTIYDKHPNLTKYRDDFMKIKKHAIQKTYGTEFTPDMYCYDNALAIGYECTIEWLEKEYNFKPTIISINRCTYFERRQRIYNKYKDVLITDPKEIESVYLKKYTTVVSKESVTETLTIDPQNNTSTDSLVDYGNVVTENTAPVIVVKKPAKKVVVKGKKILKK